MNLPAQYISSVNMSFSTFLDRFKASDEEKASATKLLQALLAEKIDPECWEAKEVDAFVLGHSGYLPGAVAVVRQFIEKFPPFQVCVYLQQFLLALTNDGCSNSTIRNYRSDINQFWLFASATDLTKLLNKTIMARFVANEQAKGLQVSSIRRKIAAISQFGQWAKRTSLISTDVSWLANPRLLEELQSLNTIKAPEEKRSTSSKSAANVVAAPVALNPPVAANDAKEEQITSQLDEVSQKIRKQSVSLITPWLTFAAIGLFFLGLAVFGYQQLIINAPQPLAYPTSPVTPNRVLSFQGRLTDTAQNPLTTSTNMTFKLFDAVTVGTELWSSGTCAITPDQDGIFNTALGSTCGSAIPATVFSERANVWLEIGVAAETLTPRQPIWTVPYALNSETIQGYPINATGAATVNTVLTMDSSGDVVLGEVGPEIRSVSGEFIITGQSLLLRTQNNGNIILDANGTGGTFINDYLAAPGATLSATYAGGVPLTIKGGPSATGIIQDWQTNAGVSKASIDVAGRAILGDYSSSVGNLLWVRGNTAPGSTYTARIESSSTTGALFIDNNNGPGLVTDRGHSIFNTGGGNWDFTIRGDTNADLFFADASTDRIGIGTSAPSALFSVGSTSQFQIDSSGAIVAATGITSSGTITFSGLNVAGGVVYTNGSGVLGSVAGSNGDCLLSNGASAPTWGACLSGGGGSKWTILNGTLFPINTTLDFLVGGTSTASARAAFININSGTPTATIAGSVAGYGTYVTGDGTIATTLNRSLILNPNGGQVGIGTSAPTRLLEVKGSRAAIYLDADGGGAQNNDITIDRSGTSSTGRLVFATGGTTVGYFGTTASADNSMELSSTYDGLTINSVGGGGSASFINFKTNNTDQMRLTSTGNLGIGSTAPTAKLDVVGSASLSGTLAFRGTTDPKIDILNGEAFGIRTGSHGDAGLFERFTLTNNGFVGIGTTAPSTKLAVVGTARVLIDTETISGWGGIGFDTTFTTTNYGIIGSSTGTILNRPTGGRIEFRENNGTAQLYIATGGNVGIGTTAPVAKLQLTGVPGAGGNALAIFNSTAATTDIFAASASGTNRFVITNAGNVGIGTSNPTQNFDLRGNALIQNNTAAYTTSSLPTTQLDIDSPGNNTDYFSGVTFTSTNGGGTSSYAWIGTYAAGADSPLVFGTRSGGGFSEKFRIDTTGNFGIGTSTPASLLSVGTTSQFQVNSSGAIAAATGITSSGTITFSGLNVAGGVVYTNGSGVLGSVAGSSGQCLTSNGASAPTWGSCDLGAGSSKWNITAGALTPVNSTLDLLVGGTSTAAAKFAFINVNSGTPTASIAGSVAGYGTYVTGDGTIATTNNRTLALNPAGGNVGIGTTNPLAKLDVQGNVRVGLTGSNSTLTFPTSTSGFASSISTVFASNLFTITGATNTIAMTQNDITLGSGVTNNIILSTGSHFIQMRVNGAANALYIMSGGNVGLGTSTPTAKLDVAGSASLSGTLAFRGTTDPTIDILNGENFGIRTGSHGDGGLFERFTVANGGNVGIGSTGPAYPLTVIKNSAGTVAEFRTPSNVASYISITTTDTGAGESNGLTIGYNAQALVHNRENTDMIFSTNDTTRMTIDSGGNVGIGSDSSPAAGLTIGADTTSSLANAVADAYILGDLEVDGAFTLGDNGETGAIDTSSWDINSSGAASGFTGITSSGTITFSGLNVAGGVVYTNGSGVLASVAGSAGNCLLSNGASAPSWGACGSGGAGLSKWNITAGALTPVNTTLDLLVGGTATASARAGFIGINAGNTPTATLSAGATGGAFLTAAGRLSTTAQQSLILGDTTTGDISLNPDGVESLYLRTGGGIDLGDNTSTKTIHIGGNTNSAADTINIGTNATAADVIAIGNNHASTTLALTGGDDWSLSNTGILTLSASAAQTTALLITDTDYTNSLSIADNNIIGTTANIDLTNFDVTGSNGNIVTAGTLAVNGDAITTDGALTVTPTTTLTLNSTGLLTLDSSTDITLDADGADVIMADAGATYATFTNTSTDLTLDIAGGNLILANADVINAGGAAVTAYNFFADSTAGNSTADGDSDLYIGDELEVDGASRFDGAMTTAAITASGLVSTNGGLTNSGALTSTGGIINLNATSNFAVNIGTGTTTSTVTLGGNANNVVVDSSTWDITGAGVASGLTGLTSSGTITFSGLNVAGGVVYTNGSGVLASVAGSAGNCLLSNGASAPSWGSCAAGATNYWRLSNGAISPVNDTIDFLVGGNSTSSAKFAVVNVNGPGVPIASISAGTNGAAYLRSTGVLGTTAFQTLGLGSNTTGNVVISPGAVAAMTVLQSGQIAIGTTAPASDYLVDITANSTNDNSRGLSITQANDSGEDNTGIVISNSSSGNISSGTQSRVGLSTYLTPTSTMTGGTLNSRGSYSTTSLASVSTTGGTNVISDAGFEAFVNGGPTINQASGQTTINSYGVLSTNITVPTLTTVPSGSIFNGYGGSFDVGNNHTGNANLTATTYGINATNTSDLTTTGTTTKYGAFISSTGGAADTNYGLYLTASGATTNYGLYSAVGTNYLADDVFIGATAETNSNTGFTMDGDDLFVAGMAGIEGNVYTDGSFIAGASTTYSNGSISQSSGETLTIGATAAALTLQTTTSGNIVVNSAGTIELQDNTNVTGNLDASGSLTAGGSNSFNVNSSGAITAATGITSSGTITLSSLNTGNVGIVYANSSGVLASTAAGSTGDCLKSNGASAPSWSTCMGGAGASKWNITAGALTPVNTTLDLLVGGTSTAAAKFAFINVNSGTPTMTIAGGTAGRSLTIDGEGVISTALGRSLQLNPAGGNVGIGTSAPISKLEVSGAPGAVGNALAIFNNTSSSDIFTASASGTTRFRIDTNGIVYGGQFADQQNSAYFLDPAGSVSLVTAGHIGVRKPSPLVELDVYGTARFSGSDTYQITGSIDTTPSSTVTGVSTLFTTELIVGDRITVGAETRTVMGIISNTSLFVDSAFTDQANDTTVFKLPAVMTADIVGSAVKFAINDLGQVIVGSSSGAFTTSALDVVGDVALDGSTFYLNSSTNRLGFGTSGPGKALEINDNTGDVLRLTYNDSNGSPVNFVDYLVTSTGDMNIAPSGGDLFVSDNTNSPAFSLRDDDVAHGVISIGDTTAFASMSAISTTVGGARLYGLADAAGGQGLELVGVQSSDPTDTVPALKLVGTKANGAAVQDLGATETVLSVANNDNTASLIVVGSGNVGIGGDATPDGVFSVGTTSQFQINANGEIATLDGVAHTFTDNGGMLELNSNGTRVNIADDLQITGNDILDSGSATRITLGATTTLTNTTLTLSGSSTITASSLANFTTAASLTLGSTTTLTLGGNPTINGGTAADGDLTLQGTTNATRTSSYVNLQPSGGFVGIGTTAPGVLLDMESNSTSATYMALNNTSTNGRDYLIGSTGTTNGQGAGRFTVWDNTAGAPRLNIDAAGRAFINGNTFNNSTLITGAQSSVLTGSINTTASTTVTGVGTLFTRELTVGDRIFVNGETRIVSAIASDTSLTVTAAFSDLPNDTQPDRLSTGLTVNHSFPNIAVATEQYGSLFGTTFSIADSNIKQGIRMNTNSTHSGTLSNLVGLLGLNSNNGSGTITDSSVFWARNDVGSGTTTTNAYGLLINDGSGAGTITNQYGVYVGTLSKGSTSDYAIYTAGTTPSSFGGLVTVGGGMTVSGGAITLGQDATDAISIGAGSSATASITLGGSNTQTLYLGSAGTPTIHIGMNAAGATNLYSSALNMPNLPNDAANRTMCFTNATGVVSKVSGACGTSSIRFKENVSDLSYGLDEVKLLRPVFFHYKAQFDSDTSRKVGFIAEEVAALIPEVAVYDDNGLIQTLDYSKLTAVNTNAIQELAFQVESIQQIADQQNWNVTEIGQMTIADQGNDVYEVATQTGSIIDELAAYSQVVIGKLRAGLITAQKVVADRLVATQTIETPELATNLITPVGNNDLTIGLTSSENNPEATALEIANEQNQVVASIDGDGNATFAGQLLAQDIAAASISATTVDVTSARISQLEANMAELENIRANTAEIVNATVSGTLYADEIFEFQDKVANAMQEPSLLAQLLGNIPQASSSASVETLMQFVDQNAQFASGSGSLNKTLAELNLAEEDVVLGSAALFVNNYFELNGSAYIAESLGVGQSLLVGNGTTIQDGVYEYISSTNPDATLLQIQPSGKGTINFLAGLMTLSENGQVTINGDLSVAGKVKTETLLTNLISNSDFTNPFQVQVAGVSTESAEVQESRFEIINELGTPVATISAQGRAAFAGGIGVGSEDISGAVDPSSTKTSGKATVTSGTADVTIKSTVLSNESLIYVTPVGSTGNQVLYVKSQTLDNPATQENEGTFVVGFDGQTTQNVQFNWWIVN